MNKLSRYSQKALILLTGLFLLPIQSICLAEVSAEKILINADNMQMNLESGKSIYTGNVKISQGQLELSGDIVTIEQKNNEIDRLTVTGKPARYNHVTDQGETIEAESEHMVYTASKNRLVMTINARLQQPDHKLSSEKIVYDTLNKIVMAGSSVGTQDNGSVSPAGSESSPRVNITLTPKKPDAKEPASDK